MNPRRLTLLSLGWLLSAAAAFSLGRISSPPGGTRTAKANASSQVLVGTSATTSNPQPKTADDDFSLAGWFGAKATSLEQVTGGRSLADHVKHLLKVDDEAVRMLGFLRLLEALNSADDLKAVLDVIAKDSNGRFRMTEQAMLLQKWAKLDAKAAATYANSQRDWSKYNGLSAVLKTWVKDNPEAAIAWAVENGAPTNDGQSAGGRGPGGEDGNWAVATLLGSLAKTNLERALEVAAEQPYSRARGRMAETLVSELVSQRGDEAARNAILDLPDDAFRAGMARELAERMANKDPQSAAAWANALPAGETRQRAMAEVVSEWAQKDAIAAGNYLTQFGAAPDLDRARQEYAQRVVRNDPEGAIAWAQAITEEKRRTDTTQELLNSWVRRDQQAAQTWAQTNGVQIVPQSRGDGFRGRPPGSR
jgi:hypothetical protein